MSIADIKRLRELTGASLSECKRALKSSATFTEAEEKARALIAAREEREAEGEAEQAEQASQRFREQQALEAKTAFLREMKTNYGLEPEEVERLLEEEQGARDTVRERGKSLSRERARQRLLASDAALDQSGWSLETAFRSQRTLCGSSKVIIGFEPVQGDPVEFRLDLESGMMDRMRGWSTHVFMPGQDPDEPDPLGAWWIGSEDRRLRISMHVESMDLLTVDDQMVHEADYPEVHALLEELTNTALRDLWIER